MADAKTDKVFVLGLTAAIVFCLIVLTVWSFDWNDFPGPHRPAVFVPMMLVFMGVMILRALIGEIYLRLRRRGCRGGRTRPRA